ncbi:HAD family phosphatase [Alphaproteobacteria bacterium]|nr:HAD family phosphatase [Alphaproteobacteria bacterium]
MTVIKAVLFDMDGVLIDAQEWHYEALNKALGLFGMEISRYDHLVTYDGLPTRRKLEMLTLERGLPEELHQFINLIKQQYTVDEIHQKCKPLFVHEYALLALKKEGMKMGVCSNSIRKTVETMLDKAMVTEYFDLLMSAEDVSKPKPDSEMYVTAMRKLGVKPEEVLILEDNENGIRAAVASGAHLMPIENVHDVTYFNIKEAIKAIEEEVN